MNRLILIVLMVLGFHMGQALADTQETKTQLQIDVEENSQKLYLKEGEGEELRPRRDRRRDRRRRRRGPRGPFERWQCYAENRYGDLYAGRSKKRWLAMDKALNKCERRNRRCWRVGCEVISRIPF